ncbi:MAG: hypothetical protein B5M56_09735 [Desulfococcus sp. 4484_241]|nr:MAG: hypothetical protein B5M56_09735 [Desulfococcus sp. 4484_241]
MKLEKKELLCALSNVKGPPEPQFPHTRTAVSLLFFGEKETCILAVLKADRGDGYPWSNQVALPGGHVDENDSTPLEAAIRELSEELNINRENVEYFGSLGHFQTLRNKVIEAFAGYWNQKDDVRYDRSEISRIIQIPLSTIFQTHVEKGLHGRFPDMGELLYPVDDVVVWGVTAKILHFTLEQLYPFIVAQNKPPKRSF